MIPPGSVTMEKSNVSGCLIEIFWKRGGGGSDMAIMLDLMKSKQTRKKQSNWFTLFWYKAESSKPNKQAKVSNYSFLSFLIYD